MNTCKRRNFRKIHRKITVPYLAHVFFREFLKTFKNAFFIEHLHWLFLMFDEESKILYFESIL